MGSSNDLLIEGTRRMVVNAVFWTLGIPVPRNGTNVQLVGDYKPSMFGFMPEGYWKEKDLKVSDFDLK
ncbi:MAG: hypothetical protein HOA81_08030 [Opitutales bacterium]|nr:hypothetical protein [Opitutales bacterium]